MSPRPAGRATPNRRRLIGLGAAACCAAVCTRPQRAASAPQATSQAMLTRAIPQSQEALPVVGFGTWQTFDIGADRSQLEERKKVLAALFEAGGKVIDSSPMYGTAEAVVGELLSDMQAHGQAFLATKVWTSGEAAGQRQMPHRSDADP